MMSASANLGLLAAAAVAALPGAPNTYDSAWHRIDAKSNLYSVELPCDHDEALEQSDIAQRHVPAETAMVVDASCYIDRALFTAQTGTRANPQNRFEAIWDAKNDPKLKRMVLGDGLRAIDTDLDVHGNHVVARYFEMKDGGFVALSVEQIALDDVTGDATRYFGSFRLKGQS
jgi:hypothetical protein